MIYRKSKENDVTLNKAQKEKKDDIKLKMARLKIMRLENKTECLEFRNPELECTFLTLKTRLASLEKQSVETLGQSHVFFQRPYLNMN